MENQNSANINSFTKVLDLDLNTSLVKEDTVTSARNATLFSQQGDMLFYQTEQGNRLICTLPYTLIGHFKLPDGTHVLFSTDDKDSEIGIFNEVSYVYTTKLNAKWLNFNRSNLITGSSKENADGSFSIYWADGRRNPDRILNLSKIIGSTSDTVRLAKLITPAQVDLKRSTAGILENGVYQVGIFYSISGTRFGSFYSLTLPVSIYSEQNNTGAIEVNIDNLDNDFTEFELVVIQTSKNSTKAKTIGFYPSATRVIHISNFEDPDYLPVQLSDLVIENTVWTASDQITSNNTYLFRTGVETIPELNYQLQAMEIVPEYWMYQVPENYYEYGDKVGYYRDEVYAFWIQWMNKLGVWSSAFHISGRRPTGEDYQLSSGDDVYETSVESCINTAPVKNFMSSNNAEDYGKLDEEFKDGCEGRFFGYGKMGYYESTELYPDNDNQFGQDKLTPIRFIKMPSEEKAPRYSVIEGLNYINILGLKFKNIPHPKDKDGNPDTNWIGYRIIRADRRGNKSVISRGLITNVRSYQDTIADREVFYTNYPYNDLSPDTYLSESQTTFKKNEEKGFTPPTGVYFDKFNFYSPHNYIGRYGLGEEMRIESEEVAQVKGKFEKVYKHPKAKLLSLFSFWIAAALGATEALLVTLGKSTYDSNSKTSFGITGGTEYDFGRTYKIETVEDLIGLDVVSLVIDAVKAGSANAFSIITTIIKVIAALGLKALAFTFIGIQYANTVIDAIDKFLGYTDYAYQYNSHALFNKQAKVKNGYKRRHVDHYQYLGKGILNIKDQLYNNFNRENSVFVQLNKDLNEYKHTDDSRKTATDFGICDDIGQETSSQAVAYYATSRRQIPNQYGRLETNTNFIATHNSFIPVTIVDNFTTYDSPVIFGGDCWIAKIAILKKHKLFTQDLANSPTLPDGMEYDYKLYRNVAYPRFWINTFKYDFSELITSNVMEFTSFARTVNSRHNLDCKGDDEENKFRVDDAYFYTSVNGVLEFFCESDYNMAFREKPKDNSMIYSKDTTSLEQIFRADRLDIDEQFIYDQSFSKQADQIFAKQQPTTYDPSIFEAHYKYSKNRLVYSLPSYLEQEFDNWQYFLSNNEHEFPKAEFGNLVSLHRVDDERILFLFDRSSPYITLGQNQLKLENGTEIQIGSGGLFAQPPKELLYTENAYGNSQSRWATLSSHFGTFYISERQGRVFNFNSSLDEVTRNGARIWSSLYLPVKLTEVYPNYRDKDNPVKGVGYNMAFDPKTEMLHFTKKDYYPKEQYIFDIEYDEENNRFMYQGYEIQLHDERFFENLSLNISYFPSLKGFVSFHDWIPDSVILGEKALFTVKTIEDLSGNKKTGIWLHSNDCQNYCNFYGKQYPFEVEFVISNKFQVKTLSSIEYYLESYSYLSDCINRSHILDDNFSHMIVYNSEQCSGLRVLNKNPDNPYERDNYPRQLSNNLGFDIVYEKVENKYRVNQFWDITKDRRDNKHIFYASKNGYTKILNPVNLDVDKSPYDRKLFRHYDTRIWLSKEIPLNHMIFKINISKQTNSPR